MQWILVSIKNWHGPREFDMIKVFYLGYFLLLCYLLFPSHILKYEQVFYAYFQTLFEQALLLSLWQTKMHLYIYWFAVCNKVF